MKKLLIFGLMLMAGSTTLAVTLTENRGGVIYADLESFAKDIGASLSQSSGNVWRLYRSPTQDLLVTIGQTTISFGGNSYGLPSPAGLGVTDKPILPLDTLRGLFQMNVTIKDTGTFDKVEEVTATPVRKSSDRFVDWQGIPTSGSKFAYTTAKVPFSDTSLSVMCFKNEFYISIKSSKNIFGPNDISNRPNLNIGYAFSNGYGYNTRWFVSGGGTRLSFQVANYETVNDKLLSSVDQLILYAKNLLEFMDLKTSFINSLKESNYVQFSFSSPSGTTSFQFPTVGFADALKYINCGD